MHFVAMHLQAENSTLQARALALMPLAQWRAEIAEELALLQDLGTMEASNSGLSREELLAQRLLQWFKGGFFKWVGAGTSYIPSQP